MLAPYFKQDGTLVPILRFAFFGIAAACLVAVMTLTQWSQKMTFPASLLLLGNASYSLYLTHVFTMPATLLVLGRLQLDLPVWTLALLLVVASVLVSLAFYVLFEKPSQKLLRKRHSDRPERTHA